MTAAWQVITILWNEVETVSMYHDVSLIIKFFETVQPYTKIATETTGTL